MKTRFKTLAYATLAGTIGFGTIGVSEVLAQSHAGEDDKKKPEKIEKRIEITEDNGKRKMMVATTENGVTTVREITGDSINIYLKENGHRGCKNHPGQKNGKPCRVGRHATDDVGVQNFEIDISHDLIRKMAGFIHLDSLGNITEAEVARKLEDIFKEMKMPYDAMAHDVQVIRMRDSLITESDDDTEHIFIKKGGSHPNIEVRINDDVTKHATNADQMVAIAEDGKTITIHNDDVHTEVDVQISESDTDSRQKTIVIKKVSTGTVKIADLTATDKKQFSAADPKNDLQLNALKLYPNPNNGKFNLEFEIPSNGKTHITITDSEGKTIYRKTVKRKGKHTLAVGLSEKSKGVYLLNFLQGERSVNKKIIVD